ncbi:MAG: DUF1146 domain-containing protein [Solobacterium sp.]|nr:DUF1146 domain-containing protein [Solobacterium sp.]
MSLAQYFVRAALYILCFILTFWAFQAVDYEKFLKKDHVLQAQVLYWIIVLGLSYLLAQFAAGFIYIR